MTERAREYEMTNGRANVFETERVIGWMKREREGTIEKMREKSAKQSAKKRDTDLE